MIHLQDINKTYQGAQPLHVLKGISLDIAKGEFVSIMGASGSGKSTLLNILGILDNYDSGTYELAGVPIWNLSERRAAEYRNIPIFNRFQTRNNIRNAKIERLNQQLQLDNAKKTLYQDIQKVYYNAVNAHAKEQKSLEAVKSSEDAFTLMQAKYENGKATITEFNESKNNYLMAESDLVQARYENIYQKALIEFYRGKDLSF